MAEHKWVTGVIIPKTPVTVRITTLSVLVQAQVSQFTIFLNYYFFLLASHNAVAVGAF